MPSRDLSAPVLSPPRPPPPAAGLLLTAVLPAAMLAPIASTVVAVALPAIMTDLRLGTSAVWWLVTGYLLVVATLQVPAGQLGDRFGPGRLLRGGTVLLAVAAAAAAAAPELGTLVVARLLQGAAGAALVPSALALLRRQLPEDRRAQAVGVFTAGTAVGAIVGVSAGGAVVAVSGWRAAFGGITVLAVLARLGLATLHPTPGPALPAQASEPTQLPIGTTSARPAWLTPATGIALVSLAFYVVLLVVPMRLDAAGSTTMRSGVHLGGFVLAAAVGALFASHLLAQLGPRPALVLQTVVAAAGLGALVVDPTDTVTTVAGLLAAGLGMGATLSMMFTLGLRATHTRQAGTTSGRLSAARYAGSIVGTAALPPVIDTAGTGAGTVLALAAVVALGLLSLVVPHAPRTTRSVPRDGV